MIKISKVTLSLAVKLSKSIDVLELTTHSWNCLRRWGLDTVADVYEVYAKGELPKVRGIGDKTITEIQYCLEKYLNGLEDTDDQ